MSQTLKSHSYKYPSSDKDVYGTLPTFIRANNNRRKNVSILNFPIPNESQFQETKENVDVSKRFSSLRSVAPLSMTSSSLSTAKNIKMADKNFSLKLPSQTDTGKNRQHECKQATTVNTTNSKTNNRILDLFKSYKTILTRFQKHFTSNDSKKVPPCPAKTQAELIQIPILVEKYQNKSTQTLVVDNEYDLLNDFKSSSVKLNFIQMGSSAALSSSQSTLPSSSSASLSFKLINANDHDRLCDLEGIIIIIDIILKIDIKML
jgi:hypothetical protein